MVYSAGGEAEPVFPTFDSVLLVTGQIVKPRRVLPVTGFHGQELWSSDVGLQVSSADPETLEPGHQLGAPQEAYFNSMRKDRQHLEGGRYMVVQDEERADKAPAQRKRKASNTMKTGKRIRQNLTVDDLELDGDDDDAEFVHNVGKVGPSNRTMRPNE